MLSTGAFYDIFVEAIVTLHEITGNAPYAVEDNITLNNELMNELLTIFWTVLYSVLYCK